MFGKEKSTWEELSGIFTAQEIYQQPATWAKTIAQIKNEKEALKKFMEPVLSDPDCDIVFTGAGTSEYVGNALYSYVNRYTGYHAKSYASTDLVETPENYLSRNKKTLLVNFGRSGNSPESVGSVQVADEVCKENVYHLFITCNKDGALAKAAATRDNAYDIKEVAKEMESVIAQGQKFVDEGYKVCENLVADFAEFNRIVYLGANTLKGIAQESQLKICELTAGTVTTTFDSPMGFRHGPKSVINDECLTVVYLSDDEYQRQYEYDIIKEMSGQRKKNRLVAVSSHADAEIEGLVDTFINFDLDAPKDNIFLGFDYILVAQVIALFKSLSYKITPDNPCPTGEVNRVVKGVTIYPYTAK